MKNLAFGALLVGLMAACGGGSNSKSGTKIKPIDSGSGSGSDGDAGTAICNVLTQTGCASGQKCTWVTDATTPQPLGHIDCVPDGTVATGAACMVGAPGATGYDNCVGGDYCESNVCKVICDPQGGSPMCPMNFSCSTYEGLFGPVGQPVAAGVCDPSCDPLNDNKFGASKTKTGTACTAAQGCYGYPDSTQPSHYSCTNEPSMNTTLYHRSPCTTADHCANSSGNPYLNGCAQGFIPLLYDRQGSMQVDCISMCAPADCTAAGCLVSGTTATALPGAAPHRCVVGQTADSAGMFNDTAQPGPTGTNGEQCMYSWLFEIDSMGNFVRSATSDTLGFCVDHKLYDYDSNGDGMIGTGDQPWPKCDTMTCPAGGSNCFGTGSAVGGVCNDANGCVHAGDFGCVSTTVAKPFMGKNGGVMKPVTLMDRPRVPYTHLFKQTL